MCARKTGTRVTCDCLLYKNANTVLFVIQFDLYQGQTNKEKPRSGTESAAEKSVLGHAVGEIKSLKNNTIQLAPCIKFLVLQLFFFVFLLKDLPFDILAQAERGGGAVIPQGTEAVM